MATLRNKCLIRSLQILNNNYRRVAVTDLKKISEAMNILQESNLKLTRTIQKMSSYYAEKYRSKLQNLQSSIDRKEKRIRELAKRIDERGRRCIFIIRHENSIRFYSSVETLNKFILQPTVSLRNFKILLCRNTRDVKSDRSVCIALARAKYENFVSIENNRRIVFMENEDADSFEQDIKQMLN